MGRPSKRTKPLAALLVILLSSPRWMPPTDGGHRAAGEIICRHFGCTPLFSLSLSLAASWSSLPVLGSLSLGSHSAAAVKRPVPEADDSMQMRQLSVRFYLARLDGGPARGG